MNASVAIQVLPKTAENLQTIEIVDDIIAYIKSFNLKTVVGPFETTIEGDYETLMQIVCECPKLCIKNGVSSAMVYVKINYAPNGVLTIEQKTSKHNEEAAK